MPPRVRLLIPLALGHAAIAHAQFVHTDFDDGLGGWTATEPDTITWEPDGGNPAGRVRFDDGLRGYTFLVAPPSYLGDWSALDRRASILYDHLVIDRGSGAPLHYTVRLLGRDRSAAEWRGGLAIEGGWITVEAPIREDAWDITGSWHGLLRDVVLLEIAIEMYLNPFQAEAAAIDNIRIVPAPGALPPLLLLAAVLGRRRQRPPGESIEPG